ncbi:MAG: hypothetical protein FWG80_01310 [Alphaproteobacteria bacterium]|nr:hypothetical protein [Alphaproteobacteria bacterium]
MNTFNKTIKITSILAVLTIIPLHQSIAAVACMARPISPTSCPSGDWSQCPASGGTGGNATQNRDCTNLSLGDWKATNCTGSNVSEFSGTSLCSNTSGSYLNIGNPVADNGQYCWCKITSIPGFSVALSAWVFANDYSTPSICADNCAFNCAFFAQNSSAVRSALFAGLGL